MQGLQVQGQLVEARDEVQASAGRAEAAAAAEAGLRMRLEHAEAVAALQAAEIAELRSRCMLDSAPSVAEHQT